jgi:hypothetical protein
MVLDFVNRERELAELDRAARHGGLLVVFGRRRVGKTRLLRKWLEGRGGLYTQAIEAPPELQVQQAFQDLRPGLETGIAPRSWADLLEILSLQKRRWTLCLDEFPYLAAADPTLPSRLQAWLDHSLPRGCLLVLAGSSTRMMHGLFLDRAAPLYGRASKLLRVLPMDYAAFCRACTLDRADPASFEKFALVGGIPKYWEFVEKRGDAAALADALYFDFAPYMEQEPHRILRDEGLPGGGALAVLEAVGRGAERPSEIASRLGTVQTNLSRVLEQLLDASLLVRDLPYGESTRSTKRVLYRIQDPTIRFWFRVYSPHRSRWAALPAPERRKLVHAHASTVFEDLCRSRFPGAQRHWEAGLEIDLVAPDPDDARGLLLAEVKWRRLSDRERAALLRDLQDKWSRSSLRARHPKARFEVLDAGILAKG